MVIGISLWECKELINEIHFGGKSNKNMRFFTGCRM